jgi:hypothetical protein
LAAKKKVTVELSYEQLDDMLSALSYTLDSYPKRREKSANFLAGLASLSSKLWKVYRKEQRDYGQDIVKEA